MTMDIYQRTIRENISPPRSLDNFRGSTSKSSPEGSQHSPAIATPAKKTQRSGKRSFDVAFLMAPDDMSKKREHKLELKKQLQLMHHYLPIEQTPIEPAVRLDVGGDRFYERTCINESPLSLTVNYDKESSQYKKENNVTTNHEQEQTFARSAFTKVAPPYIAVEGLNLIPPALSPSSVSSTTSGRSGISPDLTYQDSLSPRPCTPNSRSPVQTLPSDTKQFPTLAQNPNFQYFVASQQQLMRSEMEKPRSEFTADPSKRGKEPKRGNFQFPAENLPIPYGGFPIAAFPFPANLPSSTPMPIFPTAANITAALLPSSLAALTLPAQNICAKCNMNFRMTSDLVYHMRSHHKNENVVADPYKKRRDQDKLKCPVCNESFRERHHLTRHMTAHQDKDGDDEEVLNRELADIVSARNNPLIGGSAK